MGVMENIVKRGIEHTGTSSLDRSESSGVGEEWADSRFTPKLWWF